MTVAEALRAASLDPREARLLLAAAAGFSQASVLAHPERVLPEATWARYREWAQRRAAGEPVAYILGRREFYGLELAVNPAVLIPRPETELLVDVALEGAFSSALDLGTGCGAIALALKRNRSDAHITAVEASAAALVVAKRNVARLGLDVELLHGRWLGPVAGRRFDLVVSNPPYIAEGDPHLEALRHEPVGALVSGADGLDAMREIVPAARRCLTAGGRLLVEHGMGQDEAVRALFRDAGLEDIRTRRDLAGIPRVTGGKVK